MLPGRVLTGRMIAGRMIAGWMIIVRGFLGRMIAGRMLPGRMFAILLATREAKRDDCDNQRRHKTVFIILILLSFSLLTTFVILTDISYLGGCRT
jgi:hypothetical protein